MILEHAVSGRRFLPEREDKWVPSEPVTLPKGTEVTYLGEAAEQDGFLEGQTLWQAGEETVVLPLPVPPVTAVFREWLNRPDTLEALRSTPREFISGNWTYER